MLIRTKLDTKIETIKITILDDDELLRGLLDNWLNSQSDITVIDQFRTVSEFLNAMEGSVSEADILINDAILPDGSGVEAALKALRKFGKPQGLIVISNKASIEAFNLLSQQLEGSWAFLLKNFNSLANLRQAIEAVRNGFVMVDPHIQKLSVNGTGEIVLTEQESTIMQLVSSGKSNAAIAQEVYLSEKTVERTLGGVYTKYGIAGMSKTKNPRVVATLIFRGLQR